jgi:hypothetical protein
MPRPDDLPAWREHETNCLLQQIALLADERVFSSFGQPASGAAATIAVDLAIMPP